MNTQFLDTLLTQKDHVSENTIISYNGGDLPFSLQGEGARRANEGEFSPQTFHVPHESTPTHLIEIYDNNTSPQALHITLAPHATLHHTRIHLKNHSATTTTVTQAQHSCYQAQVFYLSGATHDSKFTFELKGEKAESIFYSGFLPQKKEHSDLNIQVHHYGEQSKSNVLIRGVLNEASSVNCEGKITIHPTASHAQAMLENKNILLSPFAIIRSQPILEVYTEEVQHCKHGATVGSLDNEALFYLQSRGLEMQQAKKLLVEAFLIPVFQNIQQPVLKEWLLGNIYV